MTGFHVIPSDWQPTVENINALPAPLRKYIHDVETTCDPQHQTQKIAGLQDTVVWLRAYIRSQKQ